MSQHASWEDALRDRDLPQALEIAKDLVRNDPADSDHRLLLLHLYCIDGQWESANKQLKVFEGLSKDAEKEMLIMTLGSLLQCEAYRRAVFAGEEDPVIFGEPLPWVAPMVQMMKHLTAGEIDAAQSARESALESVEPLPGKIDGKPFAWLGDTDWRLGPLLEVHTGGSYNWVPVHRIRKITIGEPSSIRDLVWTSANFTWITGGETPGYIPTRYIGSENLDEVAMKMGRQTEWTEPFPDIIYGHGQRVFTTGEDDFSLMDIRTIEFDHPESD